MMIDLSVQARADLAKLSKTHRDAILRALRENPDTKGKGYLEVTNMPPMPGSRKYPWLRR